MEPRPNITKPLAAVINNAYIHATKAYEAIEHRLESLTRQEILVRQWKDNLPAMIATHYPNHDAASYPVQIRMQREFEKLEQYKIELPDRLTSYAIALQEIDLVVTEILELTKSISFSKATEPWPIPPKILKKNPWPSNWPPRPRPEELHQEKVAAYSFNANRILSAPRESSPGLFTLNIAGHEIELQTVYDDGVNYFTLALENYIKGAVSSRWAAITEAIRCGIRWPKLDLYLAECEKPWLPRFFVNETFGLRGSLERRDELAHIMAQISAEAGRWYLSAQPMPRLCHIESFSDFTHDIIEELMTIDLVRWAPTLPPEKLLHMLPFPEVKSLFTLAGLSQPRSFNVAVARYGELVSVRGSEYLIRKIHTFVDPSSLIEIREPNGWHSEERLGPRARANVLVSTLIMLADGNLDAGRIIKWGN